MAFTSFSNSAVSIVVPVYKSSSTIPQLVARIHTAMLSVTEHEIILVDDSSPDASWEAITEISRSDNRVRGVRFGRNAGQHAALLAGIRAAKYPVIVTLDDDLQNPPEDIPCLLEAMVFGVDVVYGVSPTLKQNLWRRAASRWSRKIFTSTLGFESAIAMTSFRAFRTSLRDGFSAESGPNISLDALLTWSTSHFAVATVQHHPRAEGTSNYTIRKLIRFMIDTATGYSTLPLRIATQMGFLITFFGLGLLVWVIGRPVFTGDSVPGFPLLASSLAIFSGTQLLVLGVLGEYIGRIHFRVMHKPTYVVSETTDVK